MFYWRFSFSSRATVDQQSTVPLPVKWDHQRICTGQHNAFGTSGTQDSPIIDQDQHWYIVLDAQSYLITTRRHVIHTAITGCAQDTPFRGRN